MSSRWSTRHALLPCALSFALLGALSVAGSPYADAEPPAPQPPTGSGSEMAPGPAPAPPGPAPAAPAPAAGPAAAPPAGPAPAAPSGPANCATTNGSWYRSDGTVVAVHDEIGAEVCYTRTGNTARLDYSWGGVGRLRQGTLTVQLVDCAGNTVDPRMTHTVSPDEGSERGGKGYRAFAVAPGHTYKPRVFGQGSYDRTGAGTAGDGTGHFSPAATPPFTGEGACT